MSGQSTGTAGAGGPTIKPNGRPQRLVFLRPSRLLRDADHTRVHPAVLAQAEHRAASVQLRIADGITAFAGSMAFVYLHVVLFAVWMLFIERTPWPTLTLVVSLEAIFLSTFVMIGQNRQAAFQQAKADRDYTEQEQLLVENTDLTKTIHDLSQQIRDLTAEIHARVLPPADASTPGSPAPGGTPPSTNP